MKKLKSHIAKKTKQVIFSESNVAKQQEFEGRPFGDFFSEKVSQCRKTERVEPLGFF